LSIYLITAFSSRFENFTDNMGPLKWHNCYLGKTFNLETSFGGVFLYSLMHSSGPRISKLQLNKP